MTSTFPLPHVVKFSKAKQLMEMIGQQIKDPYKYRRVALQYPLIDRIEQRRPTVGSKRKWTNNESHTFYNQVPHNGGLVLEDDVEEGEQSLGKEKLPNHNEPSSCEMRQDSVLKLSLQNNQALQTRPVDSLVTELDEIPPMKKCHNKHHPLYMCTIDNCGLKFTNKENLLLHERCEHSIAHQLPCDFCPRTFLTEGERRYHVNRIHANHHEKSFQCSICWKLFAYEKNFERHGLICGKSGEEAATISSQFPIYQKFERKLECSKCGTRFHKEVNRERHELLCMKKGMKEPQVANNLVKATRGRDRPPKNRN